MILNEFYCGLRSTFAWLILACACWAAPWPVKADALPLPLVSDLQAAAQRAREQHAPLFVAFTLKRCPYCNTARRDYWAPMNGSDAWRGKVLMVELVMDGEPTLRDFDGTPTTPRDFARRYGIRSAPTVVVFDDFGAPATTPLVGLSSADFYGVYLERAIEAGLRRVRRTSAATQ